MAMSAKTLEVWVYVIVILIVGFQIFAALIPQATTAGDAIYTAGSGTATTIPLRTLFQGTGVIFYLLMGMILFFVIRGILKQRK